MICHCNWRVNKWALVQTHQFLPCWLSLVYSFLWGYLTLSRLSRPHCFGGLCGYVWGKAAVCGGIQGKPFLYKENEDWSPLSHLLKSTELSWPCRLNVTRNSSTVESLSSFSISFYGKKAEIIRNSILTRHHNLGLSNIFDLSPQSVSGFVIAFWFAVCQHYSGGWLIFSILKEGMHKVLFPLADCGTQSNLKFCLPKQK